MTDLFEVAGALIVLVGAALAALSALGVVRFRELLPRMHALTKASTGGIVLAAVGAAVALRSVAVLTTLVLVVALQLFTFPVGANLIARAVAARSDHRIAGPVDADGDEGEDAAIAAPGDDQPRG